MKNHIFKYLIFFFFFFIFYTQFKVPRLNYIDNNSGVYKIHGKIANSHERGLFSHGGLLGWCYVHPSELSETLKDFDSGPRNWNAQFHFYNNQSCRLFNPYLSQSGGQGILFSIIDMLIQYEQLYQIFSILILSLVLTLWSIWIKVTFGSLVASINCLTFLLLDWVIMFSSNISLLLGLNYLPFVAILWCLNKNSDKLILITATTVLIKFFLTGPEFLFPLFFMIFLPLIFFTILRKQDYQFFLKSSAKIFAGFVIASVLSVMILTIQMLDFMTFDQVIQRYIYTFEKRSFGDPNIHIKYSKSLNYPIFEAIKLYFSIPAISFSKLFKINFAELTFFYLIITAILLWIEQKLARTSQALMICTWISILCPLSYIIITKPHAVAHQRFGPIAWHLPFILFGMLLTSVTIICLLKKFQKFGKYLESPKTNFT